MRPFYRSVLVLLSALALASCASSSHVLVGPARPAILPSEVSVLSYAPEKFEQIAELEASSGVSLQSMDTKWDRAVEQLRKEAASLGANAIVLDIPGDEDDGAGAVVVSGSKPIPNGDGKPIELGAGASIGQPKGQLVQSLRALAIYVPE